MSLGEYMDVGGAHHAYLILGERAVILAELRVLLESDGIATKANVDFHMYEHDVFLIDDAHELRHEQSMHASSGSRKIFIVAFNTITSEAQNALLKTLEEPTLGTQFFFTTRTGEILFPTLRSRMQTIQMQSSENSDQVRGAGLPAQAGEKFLNATIPERMKMVEKYTKVKADDKSRAKEDARVFLESLEYALYKIMDKKIQCAKTLEDVTTAKRYLSDRSPSLKLLLEHLALTTPIKSEK